MIPHRVREFLDTHSAHYETVRHPLAYTAQEVAASAHVPGKEIAKTVIVSIDGKLAMAVVPASKKISLSRVKEEMHAHRVELATERDFKDKFPECDIGAMPPFGNLYGMEVLVAPILREDREISFNAGSHTELIRISYAEFEDLVHPRVADITT